MAPAPKARCRGKIKLRGLPDKYTLILVDGKRVASSAHTAPRPDLGRQDLNWISPDMIQRIEVVRGPMSSLYGSDAMGGVFNIITRKIPKKWERFGHGQLQAAAGNSSDRGTAHQLGVNLPGPLSDTVGMRLGVSQSRQNPDEKFFEKAGRGGGERNQTVSGQLNGALGKKQNLSLDASYGRQEASDSSALTENGASAGLQLGRQQTDTQEASASATEAAGIFGRTTAQPVSQRLR